MSSRPTHAALAEALTGAQWVLGTVTSPDAAPLKVLRLQLQDGSVILIPETQRGGG